MKCSIVGCFSHKDRFQSYIKRVVSIQGNMTMSDTRRSRVARAPQLAVAWALKDYQEGCLKGLEIGIKSLGDVLTRIHWSSSGRRIEAGWYTSSSYLNFVSSGVLTCPWLICRCHRKSQVSAVGPGSPFSQGSHPASWISSPASLLRHSSAGFILIWMASLSGISQGIWLCQLLFFSH